MKAYGDYEGKPIEGRVSVVSDREQVIAQELWTPHASDGRFTDSNPSHSLTIFAAPDIELAEVGGLGMRADSDLNYIHESCVTAGEDDTSVRLAAEKAALATKDRRSVSYAEAFLGLLLLDDTIAISHVITGAKFYSKKGDDKSKLTSRAFRIYGYRTADMDRVVPRLFDRRS